MSIDLQKRKVTIKGKYSHSIALFIGKIKVAEYFYDGSRSKDDPKKYKVTSPIFNILGYNFETEDESWDACNKLGDKFIEWVTYRKDQP